MISFFFSITVVCHYLSYRGAWAKYLQPASLPLPSHKQGIIVQQVELDIYLLKVRGMCLSRLE